MPSKRFWCLERQITRIMAQQDLRQINVNRALNSQDSMDEVIHSLTMEIGETTKIEINAIVKPEPDASKKLRELSER